MFKLISIFSLLSLIISLSDKNFCLCFNKASHFNYKIVNCRYSVNFRSIDTLSLLKPFYCEKSSDDNSFKENKKNELSIDNLKKKLSQAGQAGILAYGVLNFFYYTTVTFIVWNLSNNNEPANIIIGNTFNSRISYTMSKLAKVSIAVWAGSQITKIFRLGGAVLLSPFADKLIDTIQAKFSIKSKQKTFSITVICIAMMTASFYLSLIFGNTFFLYFK